MALAGTGVRARLRTSYPYAFGGDPSTGLGLDLAGPSAFLNLMEELGIHWSLHDGRQPVLATLTSNAPAPSPHPTATSLRKTRSSASPARLPPRPPSKHAIPTWRSSDRAIPMSARLAPQRRPARVVRDARPTSSAWAEWSSHAPDMPADVVAGRTSDRKRICRTFSDCATAPRSGMVSGCYPLDPFYKARPEREPARPAQTRKPRHEPGCRDQSSRLPLSRARPIIGRHQIRPSFTKTLQVAFRHDRHFHQNPRNPTKAVVNPYLAGREYATSKSASFSHNSDDWMPDTSQFHL